MSLLSDDQLAMVRATAAAMLADTCTITAPATPDAKGNTSAGPTTIGTYPCRVDRKSTRTRPEAERHGAITAMPMYEIVLPYDCPVDEAMQITVGGATFDVTSVDRFGTMPVETRCVVSRTA